MKKTIRLIALSMVLVMAVLAFASCGAPNSDPDKAKKALEEEGYSVLIIDSEAALATYKALYGGELKAVLTATKGILSGNALTILYYGSSADADAAYDAVKKESEDKDDDSDYEFKKSGKMVWFGHKDAVKAAA